MKKPKAEWLAAGILALLLHDVMLVMGCVIIRDGFSLEGLFALIRERLAEPGDAVRYLQIAAEGYQKTGPDAINLVFYPLYPYLMGLFAFTGDLAAVGMVISRAALVGAGGCLFELGRMDGGRKGGWYATLMMTLYPFSMFTVGVYTESLFLLLSLSCMLLIRKDRLPAAGAVGFLAALTRVQGMLLVFPAVYHVVAGRLGPEKRKLKAGDLCVLLIPLGFAVYLMINKALHGNPFQFMIFEEGEPWYQSTKWIGENIAQQYQNALQFKGLEKIIYWPQIVLYFVALGALFAGLKMGVRMEYLLYGAVYLGFTYLSGWMISGGRYMLCCFPLFLVFSKVPSGKIRALALGISGWAFFLYSLMFLQGYAIM